MKLRTLITVALFTLVCLAVFAQDMPVQRHSRVIATTRITVPEGDDMQALPFKVPMLTLGGGAFQTTGRSVQLSWTLSASTTVTAQNVYRSTATGGVCGSLALLASSLSATATTYQDASIVQGTTYCYTVRAFDGFSESVDSNVAKATWPFQPSAPTNLTATPK